MIVIEYKTTPTNTQALLIDEAVRTVQFVRNKCLRYWMDSKDSDRSAGKYDLTKYTTILRKEYGWCNKLNSTAVQAAGERAWSSIARFYDNYKKGIKPVGYPQFKKNNRTVEYKRSGWKLDSYNKRITFTDKFGIGTLKLKGTWDLALYPEQLIQRVRLVKRSDGYYVQFAVKIDRVEDLPPTNKTLGIDVGLKEFYTDSNGDTVANPRFLRKAEKQIKRLQRNLSRKSKGSKNYRKAKNKLSRKHLKVSRQRKDHAIKQARCVMMSNDFVAYEDLRIKNMMKNHNLAKSIGDASWYQFRTWLEYYGKIFGRVTVAVAPQYTSQECNSCGARVKKSLSTRTHICPECGYVADRDKNAAQNILKKGLATAGHVGSEASESNASNACGVDVRGGNLDCLPADDEARIPSL